jgi:hypothetical protein
MDILIPNDKRRSVAAHRCIVHLSSTGMQAEAVRAASEWQDRVVQRRVVDRQPEPEMVRTVTQGDWAIRRHFGTGDRSIFHLFGLVIMRCLVRLAVACSGSRFQLIIVKEPLCPIEEELCVSYGA